MRGLGLFFGNGFNQFRFNQFRHSKRHRCNASAGEALPSKTLGSYFERVKGFNGPLKAGLTSGVLSSAGDVLAQVTLQQEAKSNGRQPQQYEFLRTLRMFGFGFFWYGPYQYYWYNLLDWSMPVKTTVNFLSKVTLNQLVLAPVTLTAVFAWTLALQGKSEEIVGKVQRDLFPTMVNGWKFWVPAASINFYFIPLQHQVLYMSCCGVLWTAYLSYASTTAISTPSTAPKLLASAKAA